MCAAYSFVRATAAAASREQAWNGLTLRWSGILLAVLIACGIATYYYHLYYEETDEGDEDAVTQVQPCRRQPFASSHPTTASARAVNTIPSRFSSGMAKRNSTR